jgi:hypothetical protein
MGVGPRRLVRGVWEGLFTRALRLVDEIRAHSAVDPFWTFGGGTVLMLRYRHRRSRDIDVFLSDPQYLGFVTPRLSSVAEAMSNHYVETANHVKLILAEGEIDFVVAPNLTTPAFENWRIKRRAVRVETAVEVVAKKLWYRGEAATARDLFDLSLVIEREPTGLREAARFLTRHRDAFTRQLHERERVLHEQFDAIDAMDYRPTYDACVRGVERFLRSLP